MRNPEILDNDGSCALNGGAHDTYPVKDYSVL